MNRSQIVWGTVAVAAAAVGVGAWAWSRRRPGHVAHPPRSEQPAVANPPASDPRVEIEPDSDWQEQYRARFDRALVTCLQDPRIVAFDEAVVALLEEIFPDAGGFRLSLATGNWKRMARETARADLSIALGSTEAEARATLCAPVGRHAMTQGAELGQAIRTMGATAFPTASWEGPQLQPWQQLFIEAAAHRLAAGAPHSDDVDDPVSASA